jgi:hypothetical protein
MVISPELCEAGKKYILKIKPNKRRPQTNL